MRVHRPRRELEARHRSSAIARMERRLLDHEAVAAKEPAANTGPIREPLRLVNDLPGRRHLTAPDHPVRERETGIDGHDRIDATPALVPRLTAGRQGPSVL